MENISNTVVKGHSNRLDYNIITEEKDSDLKNKATELSKTKHRKKNLKKKRNKSKEVEDDGQGPFF